MLDECFSLPLADDACAYISVDPSLNGPEDAVPNVRKGVSNRNRVTRTHRSMQPRCREHGIFCDGNCDMSVVELPFPPPSALLASSSTSSGTGSRHQPAPSLLSGTEPFMWYNSYDQRTPMQFLYVTQSVHHPSTNVYTRSEYQSSHLHPTSVAASTNTDKKSTAESIVAFAPLSITNPTPASNWGCACPNGACSPQSCSCAQSTLNQYSRQSRIQSSTQPQAYCECGQFCSCANQYANESLEEEETNLLKTVNIASSSIFEEDERSITFPLLPNAASLSNHRDPSASHTRTSQPTCFNRVVQLNPVNPSIRLCVFMTRGKGFGLQTLTSIPRHSYVCEYVGEILHEHVSEIRGRLLAKQNRNNYLFTPSIAVRFSGEVDGRNPAMPPVNADGYHVDDEPFSIDSSRIGNLARFINHSCEPNLIAVNVYVAHRGDLRAPKVAFFASKRIAAGTELTAHYGDKAAIGQEFICKCDKCQLEQSNHQSIRKSANKKQSRTSSGSTKFPASTDSSNALLYHRPQPAIARLNRSDPDSGDLQFDAMAPIPLPPFLYLDSSAPPPTNKQVSDPSSIYFRTIQDVSSNINTSSSSIQYLPTYCMPYLSRLRLLVGLNKCIPTQNSCCWFHVHPTRVRLACFSLQQFFPNSNIQFHEQQLEWMRKELVYDAQVQNTDKRIRSDTSTSNAALAATVDTAKASSFDCHLCDTSFESRSALCSHRSSHLSSFTCNICGIRSFDASQQLLHQKEMHPKPEEPKRSQAISAHDQSRLKVDSFLSTPSTNEPTARELAVKSMKKALPKAGSTVSAFATIVNGDDEKRPAASVVNGTNEIKRLIASSSSSEGSPNSPHSGSCYSSNGSISPTFHLDRSKHQCQDCDATVASQMKLSEHRKV